MKKSIIVFAICICAFICSACEKKDKAQTAGEDGLVTMSAALTDDKSTTLECTIFNKTKKDIAIGEEYCLQVLKDKSFVNVPLLPEAGAFDLLSISVLSGEEYSYRVYRE